MCNVESRQFDILKPLFLNEWQISISVCLCNEKRWTRWARVTTLNTAKVTRPSLISNSVKLAAFTSKEDVHTLLVMGIFCMHKLSYSITEWANKLVPESVLNHWGIYLTLPDPIQMVLYILIRIALPISLKHVKYIQWIW